MRLQGPTSSSQVYVMAINHGTAYVSDQRENPASTNVMNNETGTIVSDGTSINIE